MQYLRGLVTRATAIQTWVDKADHGNLLRDTLDLSDLFHPDTFLNALRQQTARYKSNLSLIQKLIYEKLEIKIYVYQGLQCKIRSAF